METNEHNLRERLYDQSIANLCTSTIEHWPFQSRADFMRQMDRLLAIKPPDPDILAETVTSAIATSDSLHLPAGFIGELVKAINYPFSADKDLGMLPRETSDFFFDLFSHYKSLHSEKNVGIVEADISNMGGANDAIGRDNVTQSVAIMHGIYLLALSSPTDLITHQPPLDFMNEITLSSELNIGTAVGHVIPVRKGGDELRYYIANLDEDTIRSRLALADAAIAAFTSSLGTDNLMHRKYHNNSPQEGDLSHADIHAGFGAGSGLVMLSNERIAPDNLQAQLNTQIKTAKIEAGRIKATKREGKLQTPEDIKNTLDATALTEKLQRDSSLIIQNNAALPSRTMPRSLIFNPANESDVYQQNTAIAHAAFDGEYGALFANAVDIFINLRDPITNMRSRAASMEALNRLKHVTPQPTDHRPFFVDIELNNLQGLNEVLNHAEADGLIRQFSDIVQEEITRCLMPDARTQDAFFYAVGAARVRILIHNNHQMADIAPALEKIDARVCNEINNRHITTADGASITIADIPHPKDAAQPELAQRHGVGISYAALETHPTWSAEDHVDMASYLIDKKRTSRGTGIIRADDNAGQSDVLWMRGNTFEGIKTRTERGVSKLLP